jgi:hypothetical protein
MKTLSRSSFIVAANIVWFAQFVVAFLLPLFSDYALWLSMQPNSNQIGCVGNTSAYVSSDRLYLLTLIWVLTAPLMTIIATKQPDVWPSRISRFWWNRDASGLSVITLAAAIVVLAWPLTAALNAPVISALWMDGGRAFALLAVVHYYRSVLLSA